MLLAILKSMESYTTDRAYFGRLGSGDYISIKFPTSALLYVGTLVSKGAVI